MVEDTKFKVVTQEFLNQTDLKHYGGGKEYKPPYRKIEKVPDLFTSLFLSPINLAYKALTDFPGKKDKKETSEEEKLNEEIKRIRQLLK
jgi:hypothetical protein